jgi:hypothetical protein
MSKLVKKKPRKRNDAYLKAIIEENFEDMLRFLYPRADELFDFSQELVFMDKELREITPERDLESNGRVADILVKVHMKSGEEKWMLLHVELEGGNGKDFAYRMFQYYYRLIDKFNVPIEAIAIFTGLENQRRPTKYSVKAIDTSLLFKYRTYHVLDDSESSLLDMDNIFAFIVLACQKALKEDKLPEEELAAARTKIFDAIYKTGKYEKIRIINFIKFLKNIIFMNNRELNRNFDQHIMDLTGGDMNLTVSELEIKFAREDAKAEGLAKGKAEGIVKGKVTMLKELGYSIAEICKKLTLTKTEVEKFLKGA